MRNAAAALLKGFVRLPLGRRVLSNVWLEHALCMALLPERMRLRTVHLTSLYPEAERTEILLDSLPEGDWATPIGDFVHLLKLVKLTRPKRVLELGSYRGWTAAYIARNLSAEGKVVAVDIDPEHGSAYRATELEDRIERRIGAIAPELFSVSEQASFDFIFIDADHRYAGIRNDTEIALRLISPAGLMVWHDYANYGYFNGICQVPEYLTGLAGCIPVLHVAGTALALHSPAWAQVGIGAADGSL